MFNIFLIPLQNFAQTFLITLSGVVYTFTLKWNDSFDAGWVIDIADQDLNPIVSNIPLVTGENILAGLDYLNLGGQLIVNTSGNQFEPPTFENLGDDSNLYFVTEDVT